MRFLERRSDPEFEIYSEKKKNTVRKMVQMPSVNSLISGKKQKIFIKKLFDDNTEHYRKFLQKLDSIGNWTDSFRMIEEEFNKQNINLRDHEAFLFTDFIFRRFYPD